MAGVRGNGANDLKSLCDTEAGDHDAPARPKACDLCSVREKSICADLLPREFALVEKIIARRAAPKNRALMSEGEPNDALFVVVQGSFRLTKHLEDGRRQVTGFLFPGDFAGLRPTPANAYAAEALEDSLVCTFPHSFLDTIAADSPGVKDRLIARGQTEYHKAQDHILLLGRKTAQERVAAFIEMLDKAIGEDGGEDTRFVPLPMSRQDIADYLGLRLETLSRIMGALKKQGVIREAGRHSMLISRRPPA